MASSDDSVTRKPEQLVRSARRRALDFLEQLLRRESTVPGTRLPPLRLLAARAGVCYPVMRWAVAQLTSRERLATRVGSGTYVGPHVPAAPVSVSSPRWMQLRDTIACMVVEGRYRTGEELPATKTLLAMHYVNYRTLAKALESLRESGLLERDRRRWRVTKPNRRKRGTVLICAAAANNGSIALLGSRTYPLLDSLVTECHRMGVDAGMVALQRRFRYRPNTENVHKRIAEAARGAPVLGGIVIQTALPDQTVQIAASRLTTQGLPVALLDETGRGPGAAMTAGVRAFGIAHSPADGFEVGRFLRAAGHERVAFVSCDHNEGWSRNRLEGLRRAFGGSGGDQGVVALTMEQTDIRADTYESMRSEQAHALNTLASVAGVSHLAAGERGALVEELQQVTGRHLRRQARRRWLEHLLEQALADREMSALVCLNDGTAVAVLKLLGERRIRVPGDISVVGFDDSIEAHAARLTSYNFGIQYAARALLNHVLGPCVPGRSGTVDITGFVSERATTRIR